MKDSVVASNTNESSNNKISKENGLKIVTSKVKVDANTWIVYDSEQNINGKNYYVYVINEHYTNSDDYYTLDDHSYCVDVDNGELFKWSLKDTTFLPIK